MRFSKTKETVIKPSGKGRLSGVFLTLAQYTALLGVCLLLTLGGVLLFRKTFLERYFEKKTQYSCSIDDFDFKPEMAMIEMHDIVIWNRDPYPRIPLANVRRARLEWNPAKTQFFPTQLRLLEVEIESLTVIRRNGNQFNVVDFVEAIYKAWGSESDEAPIAIDECWIQWDYVITLDEESKKSKRMELLLDYEGYHKDVTDILQITDPPIREASEQVRGFYMANFLYDSIKNILN